MGNSNSYDTWAQRQFKRIHFVGVGGVGMGGIAEIFLTMGYHVSGSDQRVGPLTERLSKLGAEIHIGHARQNVDGAGVVVVSTAIPEDNPELVAARRRRIPIILRAEMLAELMRLKRGIAIAGTHGKTTTTSLTASALIEAGADPTYVIGGKLQSSGSNSSLGQSEWLVAEADESDASFLHLQPYISVITNIDEDHMDTYEGSYEKLLETFVEFSHNLPFYGLMVLCGDDASVREILPRLKRRHTTYGFSAHNDVRIEVDQRDGLYTEFSLYGLGPKAIHGIRLAMPGDHNVLNATAGMVVANELSLDLSQAAAGLEKFSGVGRRLEVHGDIDLDGRQVTVVDDYGHHPTEIDATYLAASQAFEGRRIVVVFQPHRFSRTRDLFDGFAASLAAMDMVVLLDVYAAGESVIPKADSKSLASAVRARGANSPVVTSQPEDALNLLPNLIEDGDVILTMGAGNVGGLPQMLLANYPGK